MSFMFILKVRPDYSGLCPCSIMCVSINVDGFMKLIQSRATMWTHGLKGFTEVQICLYTLPTITPSLCRTSQSPSISSVDAPRIQSKFQSTPRPLVANCYQPFLTAEPNDIYCFLPCQ